MLAVLVHVSKMPKVDTWVHDSGTEATLAALAAVWTIFLPGIVAATVDLYSSSSMSTGINQDKLAEHADMLTEFVGLDPRGGIFSQSQMVESLDGELKAADSMEKFNANLPATANQEEAVGLVAYLARVMLSHARIVYDNAIVKGEQPIEEHRLQKVFAAIVPGSSHRGGQGGRKKKNHASMTGRTLS